jgi:RNA polymerase sigma factor (sigma-70 family)
MSQSKASDRNGRDQLLEHAAERLLREPSSLSTAEHQRLVEAIRSYLRRWLSRDEVDDVIADVLLRVFDASHRGRLPVAGNPVGYLLVMARNAAISHLRRTSREVSAQLVDLIHTSASDDDLARGLECQADAEAVRQALRAAVAAGDQTVVRVVTYVLDHLAELGTMPSNRVVANELGLSHTGVAKALTRFREHLVAAGGAA